MSLEDVEWALGKRLTLTYETSSELSNSTLTLRAYTFVAQVGECRQYAAFYFENIDENFNTVPFHLYDKTKEERTCGGIVK